MRARLTTLLVVIGLLVGSGLVVDASAASGLPRHAVAGLLSGTTVDFAGYETVRASCRSCLSSPGYTADYWASPDPYQLGRDPQGNLVVASLVQPDVVQVTRFDPKTAAVVSSGRITNTAIRFKLLTVYLAPDGNLYTLVVRKGANKQQSGSFVVGKIQKYGPDLTHLGSATITSGDSDQYGVYKLAPIGSPAMLLDGTTLVLHTSRSIYADSSGIHHEVNLVIPVDASTMTVMPGSASFRWVSHSFNQFLGRSGTSLVLVDHGDSYPRAISISVQPGYFPDGTVNSARNFNRFPISGSIGANFTGLTVNSLQTGAGRALVTGISDPQKHSLHGISGNSTGYSPNVYLVSTDVNTGGTRFHWLTKFNPTASPRKWVGQPAIVQLAPRRFAVLFSVETPTFWRMHYVLVNPRGHVLAHRTWKRFGFRALSAPERIGNRIFWVGFLGRPGTSKGSHLLYALDVTNRRHPAFVR